MSEQTPDGAKGRLDALVGLLRNRTLVEHGGPDGFMCGWNLTLTDSLLHKEAAAEIERLRGLLREFIETDTTKGEA